MLLLESTGISKTNTTIASFNGMECTCKLLCLKEKNNAQIDVASF